LTATASATACRLRREAATHRPEASKPLYPMVWAYPKGPISLTYGRGAWCACPGSTN
jgi:hypothetical protein